MQGHLEAPMDSAKFQKLKDYVNLLVQQGDSYEKDREYELAIDKYLKVVDILLIMGDSAPTYPMWVQCTDKAQAFQKKIKNLIALAALEQERKSKESSSTKPLAPQSGAVQTANSRIPPTTISPKQ